MSDSKFNEEEEEVASNSRPKGKWIKGQYIKFSKIFQRNAKKKLGKITKSLNEINYKLKIPKLISIYGLGKTYMDLPFLTSNYSYSDLDSLLEILSDQLPNYKNVNKLSDDPSIQMITIDLNDKHSPTFSPESLEYILMSHNDKDSQELAEDLRKVDEMMKVSNSLKIALTRNQLLHHQIEFDFKMSQIFSNSFGKIAFYLNYSQINGNFWNGSKGNTLTDFWK